MRLRRIRRSRLGEHVETLAAHGQEFSARFDVPWALAYFCARPQQRKGRPRSRGSRVLGDRAAPILCRATMTGMTVEPKPILRTDKTSEAAPLAVETKLFRGLADPARLRILLALRAGPMSAGELARALGLTSSNTSNHLLCLLECGLLSVETRGRHNVYRLADPAVDRLLAAGTALLDIVGPAIEECLNYGPPSRRALRAGADVGTAHTGLAAPSRRLRVGGQRVERAESSSGR